MTIKHVFGHVIDKSVDVDAGVRFLMSDDSTDRTKERILPTAWRLSSFKQNPIALYQHQHGMPIGTWADVAVEDGKLVGNLKLADKGTSPEIDTVRELLRQGILKAVSVGFIPRKYVRPSEEDDVFTYTEVELLECSLVSVPANRNALQIARGYGADESFLFTQPVADEQLLTMSQRVAVSRAALAVKSVAQAIEMQRKVS